MKNKLIAMTVALLSVCTNSAMAAVTHTEYDKDFSAEKIVVSGKALAGEEVSVHIVKDAILSDSTIEGMVAYIGQARAGDNGEFCFVAEVLNSGRYNIFVSSEDLSVNSVKMPVDFYNSTDYAITLGQLNGASTENEFCTVLRNNTVQLGFDDEINQIIDINKTAKIMYASLEGEALPTDSYTNNKNYYKNCAMMIAANEGKLTSISDYADNIIKSNEKLLKNWEKYITTPEKEAFAINKFSGRNLSNIDELEKNISEAMILTATYYPDGYMSLKDLYSDFKDILGISSVTSDTTVYSNLAGKDFQNISALVMAYKNAAMTPIVSGGSGGSSGGSGGSKLTMGGSSITEIPLVDNKTENAQAIGLKFIDLGSVRWAYPSISVLFDMGIVSGVSETEFLPEKNVKREEFAKMLISALGKTPEEYKNRFDDVDNNAWYAGYVNCAYSEGIISGISDTEFGVAENITRQDMAVMIYRAMISKGYTPSSSVVTFSDKDSMALYATEAVAELSQAGIINGVGDNMFAPMKSATRAEAAVILERALPYLQ